MINTKLALVTGASMGLGEEFAIQLAQQGSDVILVARTQSKLEALAKSLTQQYQIKTHVIAADLSIESEVLKVYEQAKKIGNVDLLINNAGFGSWGYFHDLDPKKEMQMIDLNCKTMYYLSRLLIGDLRARKTGGIINIASTAGIFPGPLFAAYAATKSFVIQFSEALYYENKNAGVHVMALCPGATKTNFSVVALDLPEGSKRRSSFEGMAVTPDKVVREGLAAFKAKKKIHVAMLANRLMVAFFKPFSRDFAAGVVMKLFTKIVQPLT